FVQTEDGIRDLIVTGVQTCALPIFATRAKRSARATWSGSIGNVVPASAPEPSGMTSARRRQSEKRSPSRSSFSWYARRWCANSRSEERREGKRGEDGGRRAAKKKNR